MAETIKTLACEEEKFDDLIVSICSTFDQHKARYCEHFGIVLNCILSHIASLENLSIDSELKKFYINAKNDYTNSDIGKELTVDIPLIYTKSSVYNNAFFFLSKNSLYDVMEKMDVNCFFYKNTIDEFYACYGINMDNNEVVFSKLTNLHQQFLNKKAKSNINPQNDPYDLIAEFYYSLYATLQLHSEYISNYIVCLELFFCIVGNHPCNFKDFSQKLFEKVLNVVNTKASVELSKDELDYDYKVFFEAYKNLPDATKFKIYSILSPSVLQK